MTLDRAPQHAKSPDTVEAKLEPGQEDPQRGRRKVRDDENENEDGAQGTGERKRKRSRKGGEKKYLCPQDGCGKSYSRAEHLYRHQLNHTPKKIYYCDFPDCDRHFVRQDLCVRHRDRHTTKGSNLQRKENYHPQPNADPNAKTPALVAKKETSDASLAIHTANYNHTPLLNQSPVESMGPPRQHSGNDGERYAHAPVSAPPASYMANAPMQQRPNRNSQFYGDAAPATQLNREMTTAAYIPPPRHDSFGQIDSTGFQRPNSTAPHSIDSGSPDAMQWNTTPRMNAPPTPNRNAPYPTYSTQYTNMRTGPTGYPTPPPPPPQNGTYSQEYHIYQDPNGYMNRNFSSNEMSIVTHAEAAQPWNDTASYPVFDDMYRHSPSTMTETFTSWLLSVNPDNNQPIQGRMNDYISDPALQTSFSNPQIPTQTSMSVTSLLEAPTLLSVVSMSKCRQIIELIEKTFHVVDNNPITRQRDQLLSGDLNSDDHVLSRTSMQRYIGSYWYHFHDQMPILHRPTFSADKCQNLLLIAVLAIGAANLDKMHGKTVTATAADLASFLVWHLRGKLFEDKDFPPPTKLWVFQTLILLECYEKLYSSRFLHERSTIHHATTISLLRRGSALLGRSVTDPSSNEENKQSIADTSDPWWNHWITNEATKRVAYALFIIDSTHAVMFGHTAVMLAHEMRLHLPCDEALWTANSGMEVGKLMQAQLAEGIKPITFPDGLKWTLNSKSVRTNRFGRTAIMAGLLNVTWHLVQRDMLRTLAAIGGQENVWRIKLTKAFDIWEKDWDNDHEAASAAPSKSRHLRESSHSSASTSNIDEEHTFESRVVLHHLAHMGMHIDVVQCQLYAKAKRLLGRTVTANDYNNCAKKMKEWASKASARDAVFYSLKFLGAVLTPETHQGVSAPQKPPPFRSAGGEYVPRDDYLLNRPWVVYFAALVVWSYGYALDGALPHSAIPNLDTKEDQVADMQLFMNRVGSVQEPGDLMKLVGQRNTCAGMLCFLGAQFKKSRWELMHEASILMGNCVDMLKGGDGNGGNGVA